MSTYTIHCNTCPNYIEVEAKGGNDLLEKLYEKGWDSRKDQMDDWLHKCPTCKDEP